MSVARLFFPLGLLAMVLDSNRVMRVILSVYLCCLCLFFNVLGYTSLISFMLSLFGNCRFICFVKRHFSYGKKKSKLQLFFGIMVSGIFYFLFFRICNNSSKVFTALVACRNYALCLFKQG